MSYSRAVAAHNEVLQARRQLEPSFYEPPWQPSADEAAAARAQAGQAAIDQAGRVEAAAAAWAQIKADYPEAAAEVEAEVGL